MRLKKSKIKEWIREDIKSFFLEAEDDDKKDSEKSDGAPEGGLGPTKLKIDIPDSPFDNEDKPKTAKATQLKELVKKKLKELKFKNPEAYEKYKQKHNIRKSTKVNVGGKDTTAGEMDKKIGIDKDDVGGPAYPNVPKGTKSSAQAKDTTTRSSAEAYARTNNAAKDLGYSSAEDLVMNGSSDEIGELVDHDDVWESLPEDLHQPINNVLDFIRDNEMGMSGDPVGDELLYDYRGEILDMIQNPDGYGKEKETGDRLKQMDAPDDYEDSTDDLMKQMGDDGEISGMGAAEKANKKMEIDVLNKRAEEGQGDMIDTEQFGMVTWVNGDADENSFIATNEDGEDIEIDYDEIVRFHNNNDSVMKNLNLESVNESKGRRCTVKEVKKWMKGLEENRYKKTYNSDCRRVAWMVNNNLSEDYESMPISMRKKWPKAAYKRERFLAKEFAKHLRTKELSEQKLRKYVRGVIKEMLIKEAKPIHHSDAKSIQVWKNHIPKTQKLLKKLVAKGQVEIDTKPVKVSGHIKVTTTKKMYNNVIELLMKNNIKIRG